MMRMYNPPHPGEVLKGLWLDPMDISITDAAHAMGVSRKTLSKIVNGKGRVTPEIAVRLSIALGTSAEVWLGHQSAFDIWEIEQHRSELMLHRWCGRHNLAARRASGRCLSAISESRNCSGRAGLASVGFLRYSVIME